MASGLLASIGNTPLVKLDGIIVKLEHLNPSGSVKDRIAKYIVEKAERTGQLKKGYRIIEATTGNTGIAFSMVAALKGYKMTVVMPHGLSKERTQLVEGYGADIVKVRKGCMHCAIYHANDLAKRGRAYRPRQFENPWNVEDHQKFLGKEIIKQVRKVDAFVAGVGTGGTVIGVGKALKKRFPKVKVFALEPDECHLLASSKISKVYGPISAGMVCKSHSIEGIGDSLMPEIIEKNKNIIDGILTVKSRDAIEMTKKLAKRGYFVGPSSGANFVGAKRLQKKYKNVVTLFPDNGLRYLSERIFD